MPTPKPPVEQRLGSKKGPRLQDTEDRCFELCSTCLAADGIPEPTALFEPGWPDSQAGNAAGHIFNLQRLHEHARPARHT
jgi:hypothetical protein